MSTDFFVIAARTVHYVSLAQLEGVLVSQWFVAPAAVDVVSKEAAPLLRRFHQIACVSLALAVLSGAAWFVLETGEISGEPLATVLTGGMLSQVLTETRFGQDFGLRFVIALLLFLGLAWPRPMRRLRRAALALLAAAALAGVAWVGHAAAEPGLDGDVHLAGDVVHLLAAGTWLGGLLPLALLLNAAQRGSEPHWSRAARVAALRFSALAMASVGCLLVTGLMNASYLASSVPALFGTPYGRLLLLKVGLFLAMLGIAAVNRLRLMPRLADAVHRHRERGYRGAVRQLQLNALFEATIGLGILAIVGALGTLVPANHAQPWWPFSVRFSSAVLEAPELRGEALIALAVLGPGIALMAAGVLLRRWWWSLAALGIVLIIFALPSLRLFTVTAYPTSFFASPTGYTAQSIAAGARLFTANCSSCHGPGGRGDGPALKALGILPIEADLTAEHIYDHSDGDLFWWLSNGIEQTAMPGFADKLDEIARWNLIDFVHANADAARLAQMQGVFPAPARGPDFVAQCPNGSTLTLASDPDRILILVFPGLDEPVMPAPPGTVTVVASRAPSPTGLLTTCMVLDPAVPLAYGLFRSVRDGEIADDRFLIDGAGWLRAAWRSADGGSLASAAGLARAVEEIRRSPAAVPRSAGHAHVH